MGFADSVAGSQLRRDLAVEYLIRIGRKNKLDNNEPCVMPHYDHNIVRPGSMPIYHQPSLNTQGTV